MPVKKQSSKRGSSIAVDNLLQQALQIRGILKNVAPDFVDCVSIRGTGNGLSVYVEGFSSTKLAKLASRLSDSQLFLVDEIINRQQRKRKNGKFCQNN